jgi:cytochrome P450
VTSVEVPIQSTRIHKNDRLMSLPRKAWNRLSQISLARTGRYPEEWFLPKGRLLYRLLLRRSPDGLRSDRHVGLLLRHGRIHHLAKDDTQLILGLEESVRILKNEEHFEKVTHEGLDPFRMFVFGSIDEHRRSHSLLKETLAKDLLESFEPSLLGVAREVIGAMPIGEDVDFKSRCVLPFTFRISAMMFGFPVGFIDAHLSLLESKAADDRWLDSFELCFEKVLEASAEKGGRLMVDILKECISEGSLTLAQAKEFLVIMWNGSIKTTPANLCMLMETLLARPEVAARLRAADDRSVMLFVEEAMRMRPIILNIVRKVTRPTEVAGCPFHKGAMIDIDIAAANRDDRRFDSPHEFQPWIGRHRHLSFGTGIRQCIGMQMARIVGKVFVSVLVEHADNLVHIRSEWTELRYGKNEAHIHPVEVVVRRTG